MIIPVRERIRGSKYIDMARTIALYFGRTSIEFLGIIHNVYDDGTMRIDYYKGMGRLKAEIELDFREVQGSRKVLVGRVPYLYVIGNDLDGWAVLEFKAGKWKKYLKQLYEEYLHISRMMAPLVDAVKGFED